MKIAIIKLSAIGDIIHAMVVLQLIKNFNSEIQIDWIVDEDYKELLAYQPDINKIHALSFKKAKKRKSPILLIKELNRLRKFPTYDLIIDLQGLIKSALVARFLPSPRKIGFDKISIRESFASFFYTEKYKIDYAENIIKRNIGIVGFALSNKINFNNITYKKPFLFPDKDYYFSEIAQGKKNILLVPGASFPSKCYPAEKYSELIEKIDANFISIWGNGIEKELVEKIKILSPKLIVMEKISLSAITSLVSKVDLVIGSDTGPTHFAWALNVPSITLFGPTPGLRNTLLTKKNKIIESDSYVNPNKINKKDFSIKNIKVDDIVKMSDSILESNL